MSNSEQQALSQLESIIQMVAALEVDYDRLEELRGARDGYVHSLDGPPELDTPDQWAVENPDDATELAELEEAAGECTNQDDARERIQEDALDVQVRSGWAAPGEDFAAEEFQILLCTGGPAVRIVGELDQYKQPCQAWLEHQDWGTSWQELVDQHIDALLTYAQQFYFGE